MGICQFIPGEELACEMHSAMRRGKEEENPGTRCTAGNFRCAFLISKQNQRLYGKNDDESFEFQSSGICPKIFGGFCPPGFESLEPHLEFQDKRKCGLWLVPWLKSKEMRTQILALPQALL